MITKIYAIYDAAAKAYLSPVFQQTDGLAIRAWIRTVCDDQTQFAQNPEDYTLFLIGEYDDSTAKITSLPTPQSLGTALEHRVANKPKPQTQPLQLAEDQKGMVHQ